MRRVLWRIVQPIYSIIVWALSLVSMALGAFALGLGRLFLPYRIVHHFSSKPGLGTCVRLTLSRLRITYAPGFDRERPSVFCQNHVSVMDGHLATHAIPRAFVGLMEASHFKIPAYGWIMKWAGSIPVYPRASGRTAEITAAAKERAADGLSILVFPEAHRTRDGHVAKFKTGVFFMARDAGIPVVPLAVRGIYAVNRRGSWMFTPGLIEIYVGAQTETAGLSDAQVGELAAEFERVTSAFVETGEMLTVRAPQAGTDA